MITKSYPPLLYYFFSTLIKSDLLIVDLDMTMFDISALDFTIPGLYSY